MLRACEKYGGDDQVCRDQSKTYVRRGHFWDIFKLSQEYFPYRYANLNMYKGKP